MDNSNVSQVKFFEYEERAFLEEKEFFNVKAKLESLAKTETIDNKQSYFFVLRDVNVSVATSSTKTVLKYKGGQLGKGNGFEEYEVIIDPHSLQSAIALLKALLGIKPQVSEQFRINYELDNGVEIALKYTLTWGFHIEVEKVYSADTTDATAMEQAKALAMQVLDDIAQTLGVTYMTKADIDTFVAAHDAGEERGAYTPDEFRKKYGEVFQTRLNK